MADTQRHDLQDLMQQVSERIASEYRRIQRRATQDPGTAGDQGEENWASLLRDWLPKTYTVATKGRIIGHKGEAGPQVDVVVLKPSYPKGLEATKLYLAGGVAAAFECKVTLKAHHITEAAATARECRRLSVPREGSPYSELHSPIPFGLLAHSHSWGGRASRPLEHIGTGLDQVLETAGHPANILDLVCVADLGCWTPMRVSWASWDPPLAFRSSFRGALPGDSGPGVGYVGHFSSEHQADHFTPVGSLIATLLRRLAWDDQSVQSLADYFRLANVDGTGQAYIRAFPATSYSEAVTRGIRAGRLQNGVHWDEWPLIFV